MNPSLQPIELLSQDAEVPAFLTSNEYGWQMPAQSQRDSEQSQAQSNFLRKMFGQQFARLLNAVGDARGKIALSKITAHRLRQPPPEFIAATGMHRLITNHGKFAGARRHENQNAVAFARLIQLQAEKFLLRGEHGVLDVIRRDNQTNLAGGFALGFADGTHDVLMVQVF